MALLQDTQQKIYEFIHSRKGNLAGLSLRDIGEMAGVGKRPQVVAHHISQLEKKGYLRRVGKEQINFVVLRNPVENVVMIKRYQSAQCGPEGLFGDDSVIGEVPLSSLQFGITKPDDYFLIDARGDSMKPMIESGDLVLAKITTDVNDGDIAVVVHNEIPKIKRISIKKTTQERFYFLESLNSEFPSELLNPAVDDFRIVGKVKSIFKSNF